MNWYWAAVHSQYERPYSRPDYLDKVLAFDKNTIPVPADLKSVVETGRSSQYRKQAMGI